MPNLREPTWQSILENGIGARQSSRKDPKYVTHGLHPYKGKFYPQLAKALLNMSEIRPGDLILDPFCGSGTTLLEGYLNGYQTAGCDLHPLAAKIARAKVAVLDVNPDVMREAVVTILRKIEAAEHTVPENCDQFVANALDEIKRWFPLLVVYKLNLVLRVIRAVTTGVLRDFFETILSSIIREVSHQETSDLRIRRRKVPLRDADVFNLFAEALETQYRRIERFWSVRGYAPNRFCGCTVIQGDSRDAKCFARVGAGPNTVDLILTSPPYATALPYIDTDRLSLLVLLGLDGSKRRPLERGLVGSREIDTSEKRAWERTLQQAELELPSAIELSLRKLADRISRSDAGFRRQNMPALLTRFFTDMKRILQNCHEALKKNGQAMIVIGDNRTSVGNTEIRIPTTDWLQELAATIGLRLVERIDISVTTENLVHIRNAITKNVVLWLRKD
jgi:methylase of polypeptide subunit release factors